MKWNRERNTCNGSLVRLLRIVILLWAGTANCSSTFKSNEPDLLTAVHNLADTNSNVFAPLSAQFVLAAGIHAAGSTCYINASASGGNNGNSWADAYVDLQSALLDPGCSEIWVAKGAYKPTTTTDQTISFSINPGVAVYGGFEGNETTRDARSPATNVTVLSGDIDGNDANAAGSQIDASPKDVKGSNAYSIVQMDGTTSKGPILASTVLDGFTITGASFGISGYGWGGGLYCNGQGTAHECSPTLSNLTFTGNYAGVGGALYDNGETGGVSSPIINNVLFVGNSAGFKGGGIFNDGYYGNSSPTLTNVTFSANGANQGAAISNDSRINGSNNVKLNNVTFANNSALDKGGALFNGSSDGGNTHVSLTNVILWGDSASAGGAEIYNDADTATGSGHTVGTIAITIANSIVQGSGGSGTSWDTSLGTDGGGNLDADPKFASLRNNSGTTATLLPEAGSAAVDAGNDATCATVDQRNIARPQGLHCDIGAVEVRQAMLNVVVTGNGSVSSSAPVAQSGGVTSCTSAGGAACTGSYTTEPASQSIVLSLSPAFGNQIGSVTTSSCDGSLGASDYITASITVACTVTINFVANAAPTGNSQSVNATAGVATPITLSGNDTNSGGPFTLIYTIATGPANGTVTLSGAVAMYTSSTGYVGADSFTFTVSDANGTSAPANVSISVGAAPLTASATTISASPMSGTVGKPMSFTLTVDPPAAPAPTGTVAVVGGGQVCTATLAATNATTSSGSCTMIFTIAGSYAVTASYSGDALYAPSSTVVNVAVADAVPQQSSAVPAPALALPGMLLLTALLTIAGWQIPKRIPISKSMH